jgi:prolyl-tRNA editing enzyme YbaK/EbsC (Cys-tRNA(Pro) deacylase)
VSVYVDSMQAAFGRMKMCHMFADSREELDAMADRIGVQRKWIQKAGTTREHYDIAMTKRALAVQHGAIQIDMRGVAELLHARRAAARSPEGGTHE